MKTRVSTLLLAAGLVLSGSLAAPWARAQTEEERAGARSLAMEGAKAFEAGDWQQALELFQRAESLVHAPPHLLFIARSQEKLGLLVEARENYLKITREKLAPTAPEAFKSAQTAAAEEVKAIEPRLAKLTVKVEGAEGVVATVTMDGVRVPPALVGVPRPVNPGKHTLVAAAEGYVSDPVEVTLGAGATDAATITLRAEGGAATPGSVSDVPVGAPPGATPATPPPEPGTDTARGGGSKIPAFVSLGVGVVGVGLGTVFGLQSRSKRGDADEKAEAFEAACGAQCSKEDPRAAEIDGLDDDARSAKTLATVTFVVGGVGLAAGTALLFVGGGGKEQAARTEPRVRGYVGVGSVGITGRF